MLCQESVDEQEEARNLPRGRDMQKPRRAQRCESFQRTWPVVDHLKRCEKGENVIVCAWVKGFSLVAISVGPLFTAMMPRWRAKA